MADYVRLKYMCDKDFNLIGALEDMLERSVSSPNRHKALSAIGSYYLFLKRDLFRSLHYYGRIMEEDSDSCAITVCITCSECKVAESIHSNKSHYYIAIL